MVQPSNFRTWMRDVRGRRPKRKLSTRHKYAVELLEERQLLDAAAVAPGGFIDTPSARYIAGLYKDLLHRNPGATEVAGWVSVLATGQSREQVAQRFISGPEYRNDLITDNYRQLLKQNAAPQQPMDWLGSSANGLDERQIRAKFLASNAYTGDRLSDSRSWLASVYEDILGRAPDAAGANAWLEAMNSGASREQVALSILNSVEANTRLVVTAYHDFLGRNPDAGGLRAFVAALSQNLSPSELKAQLVTSLEYVNNQLQVVPPGDPNKPPSLKLESQSTSRQIDPGAVPSQQKDRSITLGSQSTDRQTEPGAVPNQPVDNNDHGHCTDYDCIPDFATEPTIVSVASGAWSDPGIWSDGRLPTEGDVVIVSDGTSVTYDVMSDVHLKTVDIEPGGRLHFRTDVNTKIVVGNFVVEPDADLEIGTADHPVGANVMAEVLIADQPIDLENDPSQYGTGLIGMGKVSIYGAEKKGFVRLAVEPVEGDTALILQEPATGWRVGDQLVLPDSRFLDWRSRLWLYEPQWEEVEIQRISPDGRVLTLTQPLAFDHPGARNEATGALEFLPHVVNRTRNVMIASEAEDEGTRGHTLFTDRADVDIRFAGFCDLGRTTVQPIDDTTYDGDTGEVTHIGENQSGRYPMNILHLLGPERTPADGYQFTLEGNVVDGGGGDEQYDWKWGIAIHGSHFGLVKDNVVYDVSGAGLVLEDGSESYNVIEHNMVVRVYGTGERDDSNGTSGTAFWFRGPNNYVHDNVAADLVGGTYTYGFDYFSFGAGSRQVPGPTQQGVDPSVDGERLNLNDTPILEFARNEVYGATASGMTYWWIGAIDGSNNEDARESVIKDLRVWNTWYTAIWQYPSGHVTIDGLVARSGYDLDSHGIEFGDYSAYNALIKNADIQGFNVGIMMPLFADVTTVEDSYLQDTEDIVVSSCFSTNGSWRVPAKRANINNVNFAAPQGRPLVAIRMRYFDGGSNLIQLDQVFVSSFDGVVGDDFQVFYWEQAPDFIVPQSDDWTVGSPVPGLTNEENWEQFGIAIGGAIAPDSVGVRDGINGFVRAL